ncbi:glycosyl hydrolase [Salmonella enterica subsp. arizonae]|uniref:Glycosyl hydrolase n=1 Tax=Salmonella enterica subsp. arizonae TaxID=59203 RepID=A0A379TSJ2_SALER|nr:glycosyl hydrolase [Salmonella enterica subsp. arizonae]
MVCQQAERLGRYRRRLFKTDFGERIPTDVQWFDGADPQKMHNHYAYIYNELVWNVLKDTVGEDNAVLFARSASVGAQQFPVHWGGDCYANYESMRKVFAAGCLSACQGLASGATISEGLRIPRQRMSTSVGARSGCFPAIAVCMVANLIVCRGPMTRNPATWCATSPSRSAG